MCWRHHEGVSTSDSHKHYKVNKFRHVCFLACIGKIGREKDPDQGVAVTESSNDLFQRTYDRMLLLFAYLPCPSRLLTSDQSLPSEISVAHCLLKPRRDWICSHPFGTRCAWSICFLSCCSANQTSGNFMPWQSTAESKYRLHVITIAALTAVVKTRTLTSWRTVFIWMWNMNNVSRNSLERKIWHKTIHTFNHIKYGTMPWDLYDGKKRRRKHAACSASLASTGNA